MQADPRPLEVQADLSSDAPPPLVAPDVVLNGRNKAPAEPPPEPAPARAEVAKAVEAARERPQPAKAEGPPRASPTYESRDLDAPPSVPVTVDPPTRRKVEVPARAALREPAAVARPQQRTETAAVPSAAEPEPQGSNAQPKLRITTDPPGALVLVDGKAVGKSPVIALGLDPSHYHAVAATLDGYSPLRRAAKLEASGTTLMHLALLPQGAAAPQARPAQAETAATTLAGPVGYLIAATSPVARVQIDGRETGRWTPVPPANPIALPAGDHTIEFVTASGQKLAEQVTIEAGKTKSLIRKLR